MLIESFVNERLAWSLAAAGLLRAARPWSLLSSRRRRSSCRSSKGSAPDEQAAALDAALVANGPSPASCWRSWCLPILAVVPASFSQASFIYLPPRGLVAALVRGFLADPEWRRRSSTAWRWPFSRRPGGRARGPLAALGLRSARRARARRHAHRPLPRPVIVPVIVTAVALYSSALGRGCVGTTLGLASATRCWRCRSWCSTSASRCARVDGNWLQRPPRGSAPARGRSSAP